ncbi:excisionase family DNA-binding protein [Tomitella cavernea]|uniref:excisionase family DNA-binding protein n=1 Tax=Tomitella cavernea TaxID=1387982 RepID=UPI001908EA3E|nr:excisionase family DNA-binding protein [Tomitella cavernea]
MITAKEAASRLGVTRRAVIAAVERGTLRAKKLPGRTGAYLFDPADVDARAEAKAKKPTPRKAAS